MEYTVTQICTDVRKAMDRNSTADQESLLEFAKNGTLTFDDIVTDIIPRAARIVLNNAPLYLVGTGKEMETDVAWESQPGYGMGFTMLPDDFLRIVSFQMTDWERPATSAITEDNPLYARQRSRFVGLKGCPQRPVIAIVTYPTGKALEFFSCRGGEKVAVRRARYIAIPEVTSSKIDLPEKCYDGIIYTIAAMVSSVLKDNDLTTILDNIAKQLLQ